MVRQYREGSSFNTVIQNDENRTPQGWIILQYHTLKF